MDRLELSVPGHGVVDRSPQKACCTPRDEVERRLTRRSLRPDLLAQALDSADPSSAVCLDAMAGFFTRVESQLRNTTYYLGVEKRSGQFPNAPWSTTGFAMSYATAIGDRSGANARRLPQAKSGTLTDSLGRSARVSSRDNDDSTPLTKLEDPLVLDYPHRVVVGPRALRQLPREAHRLGMTRPLLIMDVEPILIDLGTLPKRWPILQLNGPTVSLGDEDISLAIEAAWLDSRADGLVVIGADATVDQVKNVRSTWLSMDDSFETPGRPSVERSQVDLIACPTMAASGSALCDSHRRRPSSHSHESPNRNDRARADASIWDTELIRLRTSYEIAAGGFEAFTRCIESYLSTTRNPVCSGIAMEGLAHLRRGLEAAVRDPNDHQAIGQLTMGAILGGMASQVGPGTAHMMAMTLAESAEISIPRGELLACLLVPILQGVMRVDEPRLAELGRQSGLGRHGDAAGHFITLAQILTMQLPLANRLRDLEDRGVKRERIPIAIDRLLSFPTFLKEGRFNSVDELVKLYDAAW